MDNIDISVVIPTRNRKELLGKTLMCLNRQTYPWQRLEVIVVDDGSGDGTEEAVEKLRSAMRYQMQYIRTSKKGPASARNQGINAACADIILFTGDDILPKEDLIERHVKSHIQYSTKAVLGFVDWSPEVKVTDFMRFIAPNGLQFRYNNIKDIYNCGFRHFYTSNISLNKKWFKEDMFDEDFSCAILEDTELGCRLGKKGLQILYNPLAIGYHHHIISFESFCQRMKLSGFFAVLLAKKHPELRFQLLIFNKVSIGFINSGLKWLSLTGKIPRHMYWQLTLAKFYFEGIQERIAQP